MVNAPLPAQHIWNFTPALGCKIEEVIVCDFYLVSS